MLDGPSGERSRIRHFLRVLRRRKWIALQAAILVPAAAIVISIRETPVYRATSAVLLSPTTFTPDAFANGDPSDELASRVMATEAGVARSTGVVRQAVRLSRVAHLTTGELLGASKVTAQPGTDVLVFAVKGVDPARAVRLADAYGRGYVAYRRQLSAQTLGRAQQELSARMAQIASAFGTDSALYETLSDGQSLLSGLQALDTSTAVFVRSANEAERVFPFPLRSGLIGLFIGIALGVMLALIRDALDIRIRNAEEVEDALRVPILARLPKPPRAVRAAHGLLMGDAPTGAKAEQFRVLRGNLGFVNVDVQAKTILVTSATAGEGKTTTAANLALALAQAGDHVVLVDLDLHRPSVGDYFVLLGPGLTDVAAGGARLEHAVMRRRFGETGVLEILGSGTAPPNPGEFIDSAALGEILDKLSQRADVVVVDSPPMLGLNDAVVLGRRVDGILVISRLNKVTRPQLTELRRVLDSEPEKVLGVIVTGAEADDAYGFEGGYEYNRGRYETTASFPFPANLET